MRKLGLVFEILEEAYLKLKPGKYQLLKRLVSFLGHTIPARGIAPMTVELSTVSQWPVPKSAH